MYGVYLYNDDFNSVQHVQQTLMSIFGWDVTQSLNCIMIVENAGRCLLKSFETEEDAGYVAEILQRRDLTVYVKAYEES